MLRRSAGPAQTGPDALGRYEPVEISVRRSSRWLLPAAVLAAVVLGLVFVRPAGSAIPAGSVVYALLGLVIFAGLVMIDFQRLRVSSELDSVTLLAASIFLDILNVFQFFLTLFGRTRR